MNCARLSQRVSRRKLFVEAIGNLVVHIATNVIVIVHGFVVFAMLNGFLRWYIRARSAPTPELVGL